MRIEGPPPPIGPALLQIAAGRRAPASFDIEPASPPAAAQPIVVPQAATSVQMLVALAAIDPASDRRRKLAAQADKGLALLERLHADMVRGVVGPDRLAGLAAWLEDLTTPDDPELAAIARDIELRVRVELAKHDLIA